MWQFADEFDFQRFLFYYHYFDEFVAGTYQGQWLRGMRHGYGVRASAPFGLASHYKPTKQMRASLTSLRSADGGPAVAPTPEPTDRRDRRVDDSRGGFVLKARSDDPPARRKSLTEKSLKKGILSVRRGVYCATRKEFIYIREIPFRNLRELLFEKNISVHRALRYESSGARGIWRSAAPAAVLGAMLARRLGCRPRARRAKRRRRFTQTVMRPLSSRWVTVFTLP